jgi:Beta-lactamase
MYLRTSILALVLGRLPHGTTSWTGLLGLPYPLLRDVSSNSCAISAAWINFTSIIEASFTPKQDAEGNLPGLANYTFSVGAFSLHDPGAATMQYHHTGEYVGKSAVGVNTVDGDSVYQIASVRKMFTAYLLLVELGSDYWARPVSEFYPNSLLPMHLQTILFRWSNGTKSLLFLGCSHGWGSSRSCALQ